MVLQGPALQYQLQGWTITSDEELAALGGCRIHIVAIDQGLAAL